VNYRHLQYFLVVVQQGSLKSAAQELGVSQPALSAAIRNLEREFGAPLLDRRRDGSVPTACGQALYESAVTLGKVLDNARTRIATLRDPTRQHLRIGTGPSVSRAHVSAAMAQVLQAWPGLRLHVEMAGNHAVLEQKVVVQEIDLALCHVPAGRLPTALDCRRLTDNQVGAFVAATQVDPDRTTLTQREMLEGFRWITSRDDEIRRPDGLSFTPVVQEDRGPITVVAEDLELIKTLTLTTRSIGFLPVHVVEPELISGELVQLVSAGVHMDRPLFALTRKEAGRGPVIQAFLQSLETSFNRSRDLGNPHRTIEVVA
jgi:DNA-binding transcriptional LysR family regulator